MNKNKKQVDARRGTIMSKALITVVALVSIVIWSAVTREIVKSPKENGCVSRVRIFAY